MAGQVGVHGLLDGTKRYELATRIAIHMQIANIHPSYIFFIFLACTRGMETLDSRQ